MLRKALSIYRKRPLRLIATLLVLSLAFCLMGAGPAMFDNIDSFMLAEDTAKYGLFHGMFYDMTEEELATVQDNMFVERTGIFYECGDQTLDAIGETLSVGGYSVEALALAQLEPIEGELPDAPGEVALENSWRDNFPSGLAVGDTVSIDGEDYTLTGFLPNYRRDWLAYDAGTSADRLPSAILSFEQAEALGGAMHVMLYVSQFSEQENPETVLKGVGNTVGKNTSTYYINRNVYKNRNNNKIFTTIQRILLILPVIIAMAAAIFFAMRPQMDAFREVANQMYARGARHKDVLLLEGVWLSILLIAATGLSQLMGEGLYALCHHMTGIPWKPLGGLGIAMIAVVVTIITVAVNTRKSIMPLIHASHTERAAGKVMVSMEIKKNFARTFGKRRKYSNRSQAFWAGLATSLVFVTVLCVLMDLRTGNFRLNVQNGGRNMEAAVYTEEGKYTKRYGDFAIWQGEYFDADAVDALEEMPGVAYLRKEYGGQVASLVFPDGYSAYANEIKRIDNVPGAESIKEITVVPKRLEATQRGYTIWVLDDALQEMLQAQYPELDVAGALAEGNCILVAPAVADSVEEGKMHMNDVFAEGDTLRFGMLASNLPLAETAAGKDCFTYTEQTLQVAHISATNLWLDYGYGAYDSDVSVDARLTVLVSDKTAASLDFLNEVKGFQLFMEEDCAEADYQAVKAEVEAICDGVYGAESYFDRQVVQTKQAVKASVLFSAYVAAGGSGLLLLCVWGIIYLRSRDLYTHSCTKLFLLGMPKGVLFRSIVWEGIYYMKRVLTLMLPILAFGETYFVSSYQYGFGQLGTMVVDSVLLALKHMGLFALACIPLILLAALLCSAGMRKRKLPRSIGSRK